MSRVKKGITKSARHKKIIKMAKGYRAGRSRVFKWANQAVMKAGMNAYRDRRLKKRDFRRLWNIRLNAALRSLGYNYSRFVNALFKKNVVLNRKVLSEMAIHYPEAFESVVNQAEVTKVGTPGSIKAAKPSPSQSIKSKTVDAEAPKKEEELATASK